MDCLRIAFIVIIITEGGAIRCNFNHTLCGWSQDTSDGFDWIRYRGSTSTQGTGPNGDHTTGNSYYIYIETSLHATNSVARLISPSIKLTSGHPLCLTFWYNMYGQTVGNLKVYFRRHGHLDPDVWRMQGNQGQVWKQARVDITGASPLQVVFEASKGSGITGDIALDDISTSRGICPGAQFNCSFTHDQCGWTQDRSDNLDWTRHIGSTTTYDTGPSGDHTSGSSYYMYLETSTGYTKAVARLVSPPLSLTPGHPKCLIFWYNMYGQTISNLYIYLRHHGHLGPAVWGVHGNQGQKWMEAKVDITGPSQLQVVFEASKGNGYTGDIAIDDVSITDGLCLGWTMRGDNFDWTWQSGSTQTPSTGPNGDHTTGSGHYMYIESSAPRTKGETARLISPLHPPTSGQCLQFYYNMYGTSMGTLSVYGQPVGGRPVKLWTKSGNTHQQMWLLAAENLKSNVSFILVFEGIVGEGYYSDMAIDDIHIANKPCGQLASTPKIKYNCDFESDDICGFFQERTDDFDWTRGSLRTPSSDTGPNSDHTHGSRQGHYMFIETSSPRSRNQVARLDSFALYGPTASKCLIFWYHMYGNTVGKLSVYIMRNGVRGKPVWHISGNQGNKWKPAKIQIPVVSSSTSKFYIVFEGQVGNGPYGDLAIDDFSVVNGSCQEQITTVTSRSTVMTSRPSAIARSTTRDLPQRTISTETAVTSSSQRQSTPTTVAAQMIIKARSTTGSNSSIVTGTELTTILTGTSSISTTRPTSTHTTARTSITGPITGRQIMSTSTETSNRTNVIEPTAKINRSKPTVKINTSEPTVKSKISEQKFKSSISEPTGKSNTSDILQELPITGGSTPQPLTGSNTTEPATKKNGTEPTDKSNTTEPTTGSITSDSTTLHSTPKPTADFSEAIHIECLQHGWLATVDMRRLSPRPGNQTEIYFGIDTCTGSIQGDLLIFNKTYGQCNTHAEVKDGKMTFSNYLLYVIPNALHAIRDIRWEYNMQCSHSLYANGTFHINPTLNVTKQGSFSGQVSGSPFEVSMFKDAYFKETLQGTAAVGSPVYVQVISLSHPDVVMVLDSCEATVKASNARDEKSYPLIEHHCSVEATTQILIVRNQLTRFKFDMFDLPHDHNGIYVTCDVHFCDQMDLSPSCDQRCQLIPKPAVIG